MTKEMEVYQFNNIQIGVSPHAHLLTPSLSIFNISTMMNASCTRPSMSTPMSTWNGLVPLLETCFYKVHVRIGTPFFITKVIWLTLEKQLQCYYYMIPITSCKPTLVMALIETYYSAF